MELVNSAGMKFEVDGCDLPGCPNPATLILAFTCAHRLCKVHEYFWSAPVEGGRAHFGNDPGEPPEDAVYGCPACHAGVERRQTEADGAAKLRELFKGIA